MLGFVAFKDLQVPSDEGADARVPLNVQDLWVVLKKADRNAGMEDVCGVGLDDEDEDGEDEDLDRLGATARSSSSNLLTHPDPIPPPTQAQPSNSFNPVRRWEFKYV